MNSFFLKICNLNTEENKGKNELQKYKADNQKHMTLTTVTGKVEKLLALDN